MGLATGVLDESVPAESRGNPSHGHRDTPSSSHVLPMESRAKVELGSGKHSVFTHFSKDPNCDICLKTNITRASCRRRAGTVVPRAEYFGGLITADHKVLSEKSESRNNHRFAATHKSRSAVNLKSTVTSRVQADLCPCFKIMFRHTEVVRWANAPHDQSSAVRLSLLQSQCVQVRLSASGWP